MFLNQEKHMESLRRVKILTYCKRRKERKGWGKEHRDNTITQLAPPPTQAGPPLPLPRREGT